jgi:hypothetical protein
MPRAPVCRDPLPGKSRGQRHVLLGGQRVEQVEGLKHEPDALAPQLRSPSLRQAVKDDLAHMDVAGALAVQPRRAQQTSWFCRIPTGPSPP